MITYNEFIRSGIGIAPLGIELCEGDEPYFCTPRGAYIFGRSGVDGIHFCFVNDFSEIVFAVSPANAPGEYVHPIAHDFNDFLRLLIKCSDVAALEQAWQWDKTEFDDFLKDNPPTAEQRDAIDNIVRSTGLSGIENPWQYIRDLQSTFNYSRIEFSNEEVLSENDDAKDWSVRYGQLFSRNRCGKSGVATDIDRHFTWCGDEYYVPSVYSCDEGLVLDLLKCLPRARIQAFIEKYHLDSSSDESDFDCETLRRIDEDNPLNMDFSVLVVLNGQVIEPEQSQSTCWNPAVNEACEDYTMLCAIEHYGLDKDCGWILCRLSFPWSKVQNIESLSITMSSDEARISGPKLGILTPGMVFEIKHPSTGIMHMLIVSDVKEESIDICAGMPHDMVYPANCVMVTYTLQPDISEYEFRICASGEGDRPIAAVSNNGGDCAADIGIIGGADGSTAIFITHKGKKPEYHIAYSALRFEKTDKVEWDSAFYLKLKADTDVKLI